MINVHNPLRTYILEEFNPSTSTYKLKKLKKSNKFFKVLLFILIQIISIPIISIAMVLLASIYLNPVLSVLCGLLGSVLILNWWLYTYDLIF